MVIVHQLQHPTNSDRNSDKAFFMADIVVILAVAVFLLSVLVYVLYYCCFKTENKIISTEPTDLTPTVLVEDDELDEEGGLENPLWVLQPEELLQDCEISDEENDKDSNGEEVVEVLHPNKPSDDDLELKEDSPLLLRKTRKQKITQKNDEDSHSGSFTTDSDSEINTTDLLEWTHAPGAGAVDNKMLATRV